MTNQQESRDLMFRNICVFSDGNTAITVNLPNYDTNLGNLKVTVRAIQVASEEQKIDTKGVTKFKLQLRELLATLGADNARKLSAFARLTKDTVLLGKVDYSATDFKRFTDDSLKDYARIIYKCAEPIIGQLTGYDISVDTQAAFLGAINDYGEVLVSPDTVMTIRKQATRKLMQLFETGDILVAEMATAVEIVRLKEPIFYLGFKTAHKINVKGKVKLSVKGHTLDVNGEPLPKVTMTVTLNGVDVLVKKTFIKGGFYIKSLAAGAYQFTFKKIGFVEKTVTVNVNNGELTIVNVKLLTA